MSANRAPDPSSRAAAAVADRDDERLDGSSDVLFAPIRGVDLRRTVPKDLFVRRPGRFLAKFSIAVALIVAGVAAMVVGLAAGGLTAVLLIVPATVVVGVMYGHLVELQHECLHEHAFRSRRLNRVFGFLCGAPMMSSFSHYKYEHLRHHAFLGTPQNREFFNYRFRNLDSWWGFALGCFHLGRYLDVARDIGRGFTGRPIPRVDRPRDQRRIRTEYRLFALGLVAAITFTVLTRSPLLVFAWVLPTLLVAEATHFLIELPEHYGLNTQTDPNVLANTRTIIASRFAEWLTNYNNLHTAHHYHQGVPMVNIERLHESSKDRFEVIDPSYWQFYRAVIRGDLRFQGTDETCMTR
jgi:fatty acid desaturase